MKIKNEKPILQFNGKKYVFSSKSIIFFLFCGPVISISLYMFLNMRSNYWLQEIITKQAVFLLNNLFNMNSLVSFNPKEKWPWKIFIPQTNSTLSIGTMCAAGHIFSIMIGLIICIPHSQDSITRKDTVWRKTKTLIFLIGIIYLLNLLRIILVIILSDFGFLLESLHSFSNYISAIIAAFIFFLFLYKWIPEFFISIYYLYPLFTNKN